MPPTIAKSGHSDTADHEVRPAAVEDVRSTPFCFIRSRTSEAWATVNESVAPNE